MRVILTGGGTGGHIYPALSIGQALLKEWPNTEILYVGTKAGLESKVVPEAGLEFVSIDVMGWQRKISLQAVSAGLKALRGTMQAGKIMKDYKPDLVIGTGGYVCLPVVWSASMKNITTLLHEQNVKPGITNKFLAKKVDAIMLTFEEAKKHFPDNVHQKLKITGLPIRPAIMKVTKEEGQKYFGLDAKKLTLLSAGGSRGAKSINQAMVQVCKQYAARNDVQVIHITGQKGYEDFLSLLKAAGIDLGKYGNIIVRPYINQMEYALAAADLCVARAGAAFLAEMTAKGMPGILIPYPYAAENHQEYNALSLVNKQAAHMILDKDLTGEELLNNINGLLFAENKRKIMSKNSYSAGKRDAIEKILQVVKKYVPNG